MALFKSYAVIYLAIGAAICEVATVRILLWCWLSVHGGKILVGVT